MMVQPDKNNEKFTVAINYQTSSINILKLVKDKISTTTKTFNTTNPLASGNLYRKSPTKSKSPSKISPSRIPNDGWHDFLHKKI
jgi:hypothetical protein